MNSRQLIIRIRKWAPYLKGYCREIFITRPTIKKPPILIVGCGHSGTSLMLAILAAHAKFHVIENETNFASRSSTRAKLTIMGFNIRTIATKKTRWIEKTPKHIYHIEHIQKLCPKAKIIMMIRDGRDVACSWQDRNGDLVEGISRWVNANTAGKKYWNYKDVYVQRYEDLVTDFKGSLTRLMLFLEEPYDSGLENYYQNKNYFYSDTISKPSSAFGQANHAQMRNWQINQPIFDGRGKWERLSRQEYQQILRIGGELLEELNYI